MKIELFKGFPVDKEWPQVELHVTTPDQPGTVSVPMIVDREAGSPTVIVFTPEGHDAWSLPAAELRDALTRAIEILTQA